MEVLTRYPLSLNEYMCWEYHLLPADIGGRALVDLPCFWAVSVLLSHLVLFLVFGYRASIVLRDWLHHPFESWRSWREIPDGYYLIVTVASWDLFCLQWGLLKCVRWLLVAVLQVALQKDGVTLMVLDWSAIRVILLCNDNPIFMWSVYLLAHHLYPNWFDWCFIGVCNFLSNLFVFHKVLNTCSYINPDWTFFSIFEAVTPWALSLTPPLPTVFVTALGMKNFLILVIEIQEINIRHVLGDLIYKIRHFRLSFDSWRNSLKLSPL